MTVDPAGDPSSQRLFRWERAALSGFVVALLMFGMVVEWRSVFLNRRMTDADDYFRAAWAVRTGQDMYSVVDTNGWHYTYPPLLAILLQPLANPPPGANNRGYVPYRISVAAWYTIGVVLFLLAIHWLASALERCLSSPARAWDRRWFWLRFGTILMCLMAAGRTLSRGQVNMLLLVCFAGMIALLVEKRRFAAGLCLSIPISIKLFPVLLLIAAIIRRDWRGLAGSFCGLIFALLLVPVLALGERGMLNAYQHYSATVIRPTLGLDPNPELVRANDSQSFAAVLHNLSHPDRATRPPAFAPWVRRAHWILSAIFGIATVAAGLRTRRRDAVATTLFLGALIVVILPMSPVCHIHYFIFATPLVMGLLATMWQRTPFPQIGRGYASLFGANVVLNILPSCPGLEAWKDFGIPLAATLLLWGAGIFELLGKPVAQLGESAKG